MTDYSEGIRALDPIRLQTARPAGLARGAAKASAC